MAAQIRVDVAMGLDDKALRTGLSNIPKDIKKAGLEYFVKLKLDAKDFRQQAQRGIAEAFKAAQKAGALSYMNKAGKNVKVNPFSFDSMTNAIGRFTELSQDSSLGKKVQNQFEKAAQALKALRGQMALFGQEYKNQSARIQNELGMATRLAKAQNTGRVQAAREKARKEEMKELNKEAEQDELYRRRYLAFAAEQTKIDNAKVARMARLQKEANARAKAARAEYDRSIARGTDTTNPELVAMRKYYKQREKLAANAYKEEKRLRDQATKDQARAAREQQQYNKALFNAGVRRRREAANVAKQAERAAVQQTNAQNRVIRQYQQQYGILGGLKSRLASYMSIYAIANFGRKVAETTGYFEKQQVALEGILGSASKAQTILSQIKNFALRSPFQTKELVNFTKQLSAFSIPADELFETTKRLADISAGLGVDMGRIILAYGQVRSAAVLRGQELRQFTEAGIPLVSRLADKFTQLRGEVVTTADVFELISKRQVSFQMVADVLADMTKEGGQFYKMQENITDTLYGQMQKLQDMWTIELDKLGKGGNNNFLMGVVKLLQLIIQHTKGVSAALISAFTLNWAINNVRRMRMEWELMDVQVKKSIGSLKQFRMLRLKAFAGNLGWGVAMAGVGFALGAIIEYFQKLKEVDKKMEEISNSFNKETNKMIGGFDELVLRLRSAKEGTKAYNDAIETLKTNYGEFVDVNKETIDTLLSEQKSIDGTITEYQKLRDEIAAAIKLKQEFNELKTQKETLAGLLNEKAAGSDFWGTGYNGVNNAYADMVRNILAALYGPTNNEEAGRRINELFGTNFNGNIHGELKTALDDIAKKTIDQFTTSIEIPRGFSELSDEEKKKYLRGAFIEMYKGNFSNKFLFNNLSLQENETLKNLDSVIAKKIFAKMSDSGSAWDKFIKAADEMAGNGTDLLSTMIRINNEFDKYNPSENEGIGVVGKQEWTNQKYISLLKNASKEFKALGGDKDKLDALTNLLNKPYSPSSVSDITTALNEFFKTIEDASRREVVANATKRFKDGTDILTEQEAKIVSKIDTDATWAGINRGEVNGVKLQSFIDNYNPAGLGEQTVQQTRDKIRSAYDDLRKELKTYEKNAENFTDDIALINAKMRILERLAKGDLYSVDLTEKKNNGNSGGGWRRMFSDLFGYIKEARTEEKKLVEFSAGLTEELFNQISSNQLDGTAVSAFWKGNNPFKNIIDKIGEYGLETEIFDEKFLKDKLSNITVEMIKTTGTVNYMDAWNKLIEIISQRANQLKGRKGMESTYNSIMTFLQQMSVEFEKYFSKGQVEKLIAEQLKEMRQINGQFEKLRSEQKAIDSIRSSSNALRAYQLLGSRGYVSSADVTTHQLQALLGAGGGRGLSLATPLAQLINGGSLGVASISQILAIKQSLSGISTKDMKGEDEATRQANFNEFKSVLSQFDQLLGQLVTDIEEDFQRLMAIKDPTMKATDDIINAYDEYSKVIDLWLRGLKNGDIRHGTEADNMLATATQNLYTGVAKGLGGNGMPEYINRLFGESGTSAGVSNNGFMLGMLFGNGGLIEKIGNSRAEQLREKGLSGDELENATKKAAEQLQNFADKIQLTSAIIQKVDSYIQGAAKFANKLIDALDASNRIVTDQVTGEYTYEHDYSTAKEAINMIAEYSSGISDAFKAILTGDIFGGIIGLGGTIAKFFEDLFGIGDSQIQKQQDKLIMSNKSLEKAMNKLQDKVKDLAGVNKWDNLTEQIKNLRKQEANQRELKDLEVNKKHGDLDKAESYSKAAEDAAQAVKDIIRGIKEEIFGVADEVASKLTDPLVEAFRNGTNAARQWRDAVRGYVGDVLKEVLMTKVISPKIWEILDSFGIKKDENQSADDILAMFMDPAKAVGLRNDLFSVGDWAIDWYNSLPKSIQEMIGWNSNTSALSGGIQGMTEDTARTLEGLANSMLAQLIITNRGVQDVSAITQSQLNELRTIQVQTKAIAQASESIRGILQQSQNGTLPLKVEMR